MPSGPIRKEHSAAQLWSVGKLLFMIVAALLIVTVVGCMVGPDYKPPTMKLPAQWNGTDQQMKDAANQGTKTDLATWWQAFNDPLLDAVIAEALSSNLDEKIALARIREERAYVVISRAGLYPSIDMSGSYTRQRYSANTPFGFFPQVLPRDENIYESRIRRELGAGCLRRYPAWRRSIESRAGRIDRERARRTGNTVG